MTAMLFDIGEPVAIPHSQWCVIYNKMRDMAERVSKMRLQRARVLCKEAGLDPGCIGVHPHNAMCGFESGHPWPGVNYSKVRACLRMLDLQFEPHRILDRWCKRVRSIPGK